MLKRLDSIEKLLLSSPFASHDAPQKFWWGEEWDRKAFFVQRVVGEGCIHVITAAAAETKRELINTQVQWHCVAVMMLCTL